MDSSKLTDKQREALEHVLKKPTWQRKIIWHNPGAGKTANSMALSYSIRAESDKAIEIERNFNEINEQTMEYLARRPSALHDLTSRQFEEVMARLYTKLGYSVQLTKATRDGGKDIFVAEKKDIGSIMFYVECKKNAENRPVGTDAVDRLLGAMARAKPRPNGGIIATTSRFAKGVWQTIKKDGLEHIIQLHDFDYICGLFRKAYLV